MHQGPSDWRTNFATALTLSTAAVVVFTVLLALVGVPPPVVYLSDQSCCIMSCVVSEDGQSVLLMYRKPREGGKPPRNGLALLNLDEPGDSLQAIPTCGEPWRLTRLGSRTCYATDGGKRTVLRSVDSGKGSSSADVILPMSRPAELAASADGKTLVALVMERLQVLDAGQQSVRWRLEEEIECFAFDERCGLFAALGCRIVELSPVNGAVLRTIATLCHRARTLAVSPDGKSLAWLDWNGEIGMLRVGSGKQLWTQADHAASSLPASHRPTDYARFLAFSSDGRYLATAACEGEWVLAVWNARTGVRTRTLRGHDGTISGAAFLPGGSLASWGADGTLRLWNVRRGAIRRIFRTQALFPNELKTAGDV